MSGDIQSTVSHIRPYDAPILVLAHRFWDLRSCILRQSDVVLLRFGSDLICVGSSPGGSLRSVVVRVGRQAGTHKETVGGATAWHHQELLKHDSFHV